MIRLLNLCKAGESVGTGKRISLGGFLGRRKTTPQSVPEAGNPNASKNCQSDVACLLRLSREILTASAQASHAVLANEILRGYQAMDRGNRIEFLRGIAAQFGPDEERLRTACRKYLDNAQLDALISVGSAVEPPRQELFRRLNFSNGGTVAIVGMRSLVLSAKEKYPELQALESDLFHLLRSWFNRGFLQIRQIEWSSGGEILERVIKYEAVHPFDNWADLQRRLGPEDRRCYAFFHPAMPDEPLIFVQVALTKEEPHSIQELLAENRIPIAKSDARVATFYSISNCHAGLAGITFGDFLIKQAVADLGNDLPAINRFITLSPMPGLAAWVTEQSDIGDQLAIEVCKALHLGGAPNPSDLVQLGTRYLLEAKCSRGRVRDPVARFHLGNGATIERLCPLGDRSKKGLESSFGLMVNYLYEAERIASNRDSFIRDGRISARNPIRNASLELDERELAESSDGNLHPHRAFEFRHRLKQIFSRKASATYSRDPESN